MDLTPIELKFLTVMNETRLAEGKMFGRYFEEVKEKFKFSNAELDKAVKKLESLNLLTKVDTGGKEFVYFHTEKVVKEQLDSDLIKIRH